MNTEYKHEQLNKFTELFVDYLEVKAISRMLGYDEEGAHQKYMNAIFSFVGDLIDKIPSWRNGVPDSDRYVWISFLHSDGVFYHDTDQWNPETKEWKRHNDKNILAWCEIPPLVLNVEVSE